MRVYAYRARSWNSPSGASNMLVLSRSSTDRRLLLSDNVVITIVSINGDKIRLGIDAPRDLSLVRNALGQPSPDTKEGDVYPSLERGVASPLNGDADRLLACSEGDRVRITTRNESQRESPTQHTSTKSYFIMPNLSCEVLLQASFIAATNDKAGDGHLIQAVTIPWFRIIREIERNARFLYEVPWRKLEELIAGAYEQAGWSEVVLTHRSGDHGRDIIATKPGFGTIRIVDQVKAYHPNHLVTADDVRSMLGVLSADQNVSKGIITTTSGFAPGIRTDSRLQAFMPYRMELRDGPSLIEWLKSAGHAPRDSPLDLCIR